MNMMFMKNSFDWHYNASLCWSHYKWLKRRGGCPRIVAYYKRLTQEYFDTFKALLVSDEKYTPAEIESFVRSLPEFGEVQ